MADDPGTLSLLRKQEISVADPLTGKMACLSLWTALLLQACRDRRDGPLPGW